MGEQVVTEGRIERERKYRLDEVRATALRRLLQQVGEHVRGEFQVTEVLDHPQLRLRERGIVLRLRWTDGVLQLTFKPPQEMRGDDKVRRELTLPIGPGVQTILRALGFETAVRYVKQTEIYAIGKVLIYVDHVEDLGWFCEIEARDLDSDLEVVARLLRLERGTLERETYPDLAERARR